MHKPMSFRIRADLFAQLAQMETAGLPFNRAIAVLNLPGAAQTRVEAMRGTAAKGNDPATAGERSGLFTKLETRLIRAALNISLEQITTWVPRVLYGLVALWIAYGLLAGGAFMPRLPTDL